MMSPLEQKLNMPMVAIQQGVTSMDQETAEKLVRLLDALIAQAGEDGERIERIEKRLKSLEDKLDAHLEGNGSVL